MSLPSSESKNKPANKPSWNKAANRAVGLPKYRIIWETRGRLKTAKSLPADSPVGRNEPPVSIGCHTHLSEPIGDENRIASVALRKAVFAGLGKDGRSDKGAVGRELRSVG
jgi:hypothetical protein